MDGITLRNAVGGDLNFLRRTWLTGLRETPSGLPKEFWWPAHRAYVESCLADETSSVVIAAAADKLDEIVGWAVARPGEMLEWVYVRKGNVRGKGLAGLMLRQLGLAPGCQGRWRDKSGRLRLRWSPRM